MAPLILFAKNILTVQMNRIFCPQHSREIYLYAPPYKRASAGVTVMHMLCDQLNRHGYPAYMVPDYRYFGKFGYSNFSSKNSMICPVVSRLELERSLSEKKIPIVIYPETILGNPLNAKNIVRYLLYYNSALQSTVDALANIEDEGLLYYTNDIRRSLGAIPDRAKFASRLTMPVQDPSLYQPLHIGDRVKEYYYAEKFIHVHKCNVPNAIAARSSRITRDGGDSPTPEQLIRMLSEAKILHVFEDTALSYEALLAGCVVNYHPSGIFNNVDKSTTIDELGVVGTISSFLPNAEEIKKAQDQVHLHQANYQKWMGFAYSDFLDFLNAIEVFHEPIHSDFYSEVSAYAIGCEKHGMRLEKNRKKKFSFNKILKMIVKLCWRGVVLLIGRQNAKHCFDFAKRASKKLPYAIYQRLLSIYIRII